MKSQFRGYFPPSDETVSEIWKKAHIVFDTNMLLNLYRYSDAASSELLEIMKGVAERLWLPHQVMFEFLENRHGVLHEQEEAYQRTSKELSDLVEKLKSHHGHPSVSEESLEKLDQATKAILAELNERAVQSKEHFGTDPLLEEVARLYEERVESAYSTEELKVIFEEGKGRYAEEIPPGYEDKKKVKDPKTISDFRKIYGDFLLWKQTVEHSKSAEVPVILVTQDAKKDWWTESKGKKTGPRPELIQEFFEETGQDILIYSPERFLELSRGYLEAAVSERTIEDAASEAEAREEEVQEPLSSVEKALLSEAQKRERFGLLDFIKQGDEPTIAQQIMAESHRRELDLIKSFNLLPHEYEAKRANDLLANLGFPSKSAESIARKGLLRVFDSPTDVIENSSDLEEDN